MLYEPELFIYTTCCGGCDFGADKVDVYYWPDPLADTSCLSIIGSQISDVADGATTDSMGSLYWGCTIRATDLGVMDNPIITVVLNSRREI